ncbi:helix-turn-helix domain-containing protein [Streptomyces sp. GZWMJZ-114]|uniref:helix-turn-helix domain-containing protein n=1 Tax=Streptomyces sp. GZWMJZ-114 TaxID=2494734 RepID=UPI001F506360|nr:helix-turn-helix domain-containing protein [Streptomyces sp. GZWMJZ-114]
MKNETPTDLPFIKRHQVLRGAEARDFAAAVVTAYKTMSVRAIARKTGRSYGAIHRLLREHDVTMRPRGGDTT